MHQHSRLYTQGFFSFMCITLYFHFSLVRLWIYKERGREEGAFFGIINSRIVTVAPSYSCLRTKNDPSEPARDH